MQEVATYAEIKHQYDGEWVLIIDPVTTKDLEIVEGRVACHSKDRDEVYRIAKKLKPKRSAILFLGKPPKNMEFALCASSLTIVAHTLPAGASVDGLLGLDFFRKTRLKIDFRKYLVKLD